MTFTARQIAEYLGGVIDGDENVSVNAFAKIEEATTGSLTFLANPKYAPYIYTTQATIVLVNNDFIPERPISATLIRTPNAYESLARLMTLYESVTPRKAEISSLAYVADSAKVGQNVSIAPFAYIGENVVIGDDTIVNPHVTIYHDCKVGARCILHAGCVIGADGFGFAPQAEGYEKIPQIGIAILEDDVELGANTCIDRATMGATVVKKGAKIDNLVQVAHNVVVGENTVIAAQSGIAGSSKIGQWCMLGGQTGVAGHIAVGDRVKVGGSSSITGNVRNDKVLFGYPAIDHAKFARCNAVFRSLPDISKELVELKKEVEFLKQQLGQQG